MISLICGDIPACEDDDPVVVYKSKKLNAECGVHQSATRPGEPFVQVNTLQHSKCSVDSKISLIEPRSSVRIA